MANTKKKTTTSKSTKKSGVWGINKVSFWTIVAVALLYAISLVLSACGINAKVVGALQGLATATMIIIVSILAWRYVRAKQLVWKILYIVCLLIVIAGIIIPLVI